MKLPSKSSVDSNNKGVSNPLGAFRKTAALKVDAQGNISGWSALWDAV